MTTVKSYPFFRSKWILSSREHLPHRVFGAGAEDFDPQQLAIRNYPVDIALRERAYENPMSDKRRTGIATRAMEGRGAAWGEEANRGVVRVFDPEGKNVSNYATGLRNCAGLAIQPDTNNLWCVVNERDHLGPDLVPDFMARVQEGAFYGWPWYYIGDNEDPALKGKRPDLKGQVSVPEVLIQAHSSALSAVFYDRDTFPAGYHGDAFVALHGSHTRPNRTGYKVIRVRMKDGNATGGYEDFMTGFMVDNDSVWGRPAGVAVTRDGALLVSDDANGTIFRVTRK